MKLVCRIICKMDVFKEAQNYDSKKIYQVQALYNTSSTLEFVLQPDRDHLFLSDITLNFEIEIDGNYVMDNQADKLFDSVEVIVAGEKISSRSNSNEYFLAFFFKTKANYSYNHYNNMLAPAGWWSDANIGTSFIKEEIAKKKTQAVDARTQRTIKDQNQKVTSRLYRYSMSIASPLFQQTKPLPSNVPIQINFKRAKPSLAVIKCTTNAKKYYDDHSIDLIKPFLEVTALQSEKLSKILNLRNKIVYPIEDNVIRIHTIESGTNNVNFSANSGGKLPKMIFTGLTTPDIFNGDEEESSTGFHRCGMSKLELFCDNKSLPGSQVLFGENDFVDAYAKFFRQTKMLPNPMCGKLMNLKTFGEFGNVMTAYDLSKVDPKTGWLSIKIDFEKSLTSNLVLVVFMIYEKEVIFEDGCVDVK